MKRAPSLLSLMLEVAADGFRARGMATEIKVFGMADARVRFPAAENCGRLRAAPIRALYEWADFGVVASLTNISLVNYEMLACGLPVITTTANGFAEIIEPGVEGEVVADPSDTAAIRAAATMRKVRSGSL